MSKNSLATKDQLWVERQAVAICSRLATRKLLDELAGYWKAAVAPSPHRMELFADEFERVAFAGIMHAINSDPRRPVIHTFGRLAQLVEGIVVPPIRTFHANCDYIYRFIPVDALSSLKVRGRVVQGMRPHSVEYALVSQAQTYEKTLSFADLVIEEDGTFEIDVSPSPDSASVNHFTVSANSHQLLLRDVIANPGQRPLELELVRDDGAKFVGLNPEAIIDAVGRELKKHIDDILFVNDNIVYNRHVNIFSPPTINKGGVYSATQAYSPGHFNIEDDEALFIKLTLGSASYATVPMTNVWGGMGDVLGRCSNLSTPMMAPEEDGSYEIVIAHADPHLPNWVQTGGANEGAIFFRWVGLSDDSEVPTLNVEVRKLADIRAAATPGPDSYQPVHRQRLETYRKVMG